MLSELNSSDGIGVTCKDGLEGHSFSHNSTDNMKVASLQREKNHAPCKPGLSHCRAFGLFSSVILFLCAYVRVRVSPSIETGHVIQATPRILLYDQRKAITSLALLHTRNNDEI